MRHSIHPSGAVFACTTTRGLSTGVFRSKSFLGLYTEDSRAIRHVVVTSASALLMILAGCEAVVVSSIVSKNEVEKALASEYVHAAQVQRLASGLSLQEFEEEMWALAPDEYAEVRLRRMRQYVRRFSKGYRRDKSKNQTRIEYHMAREFPEIKSEYDGIQEKRSALGQQQALWDLRSVAYRAARLRRSVSEETIVEELRATDPFFSRRFDQAAKLIGEQPAR